MLNSTSNSTITIIIVLAVVIGLMLVLILIVGILIAVYWRRKVKTFVPPQLEETYGYATIEEMLEVLTKSNQAYAAANLARPRESFDNAGYEMIDKKEYSYVTNRGDRRPQMVKRGSTFDRDAYEVIDEEDVTGNDNSGANLHTTERASIDHDEYVDMSGAKNSDNDNTEGEEYVSMHGEDDTPHEDIQDPEQTTEEPEPAIGAVENEAYAGTVATKMEAKAIDEEPEPAIGTVQNEAYAGIIATKMEAKAIDEGFEITENEAYASNIAQDPVRYENTYEAGWIRIEQKKSGGEASFTTSVEKETRRIG